MDLKEYYHHGILPLLMVVSAFAFTDITSEVDVWGVEGGRVELPCEPQLKEPNDHPVLVLWYLSSNTTPVYSYDARTGDFSSGNRWADMHTFGNRAYFSALANPPSLILEPLRSDDGGIYTCRIDYRRSPSTSATTNLTVIVPPGPPVVLWNGVGVVGSVGPLQENSQVTLICRSNGGSPPPKLTWWWRGSKLSHQTSNVTFNLLSRAPKVESTVWLRATRGFHGALLTCHAHPPAPEQPSRNIILQPRTASVSLNITLPPLEISILGNRGPVSAGTALQLECRSVGSNPPATLTWWRGHLHLTEVIHSIYNGGNVTTATLTVMASREHDGATFACTASNPLLPNSPITRSVRLEVHYSPVATLRLGRAINSSFIQEGTDIYFECDVAANPEVQRIDWTHNGVMLKHNLKAGIMMSGLSLALPKLSRGNSGSYTCIAYNSEGRNTSNTLHITVRHTPHCVGGTQAKTVGAARGSATLLTCRVEAEPAEVISWEWVRIREDNTEEKVPQKNIQSHGMTSSVRLTPVSQGDYGYVTCRATNSIGRQVEPCVINFVPAGPPDPPTNCSATPLNRGPGTTSLAISCHEGFDGGLPQEFNLEVQQEQEIIANYSSSEFPEWVVDQLLGGASVIIRVTSQNAHGKSEPLMLEVHTPLAQHREASDNATKDKKTLLGATTLLGALVGVVVVLVILIVVSVIIARKAKPRPKNKPTIVSTTPVDSTWECYNPDLVSSAQQRQPNKEALTVSQQSLPSPRLHTLMQKHRNTCLPLNEQAQNCIQMHRKSLPHLLIGNRELKGSRDMELQNFDIEDSGSDSNMDSDVESVIEVTNPTTKGLASNKKVNTIQPNTCSPLANKNLSKGKSLGSCGNISRSSHAISYEREASKPLLTKDEKDCLNPRVVNNLHSKNAPNISASERTRILPKSPERHRKERTLGERDQLLGDQTVCQSKTSPDMTPPPKPPRVFNHPQASPDSFKRGSRVSLVDYSACAQTKQNQRVFDSKGNLQKDTSCAPLAEDEVRDSYPDAGKGTRHIRQNGTAKRNQEGTLKRSPSRETSI